MGQFYDTIPIELVPWILKQEIFWVATAPLSPEAHVNVSPKGVRDSFHYVSPTRVWYQDLTGSGVETISHLRENGRITLMFSAFEGPPRIVRLFGIGTVHEFGSTEYEQLIPLEHRRPGSRAAIVIDVHKVGSSCGYAVPFYEFRGHRQTLLKYLDATERADQTDPDGRSDKGIKAYWEKKNLRSIDGIPGLTAAHQAHNLPTSVDALKHADASEDGTMVRNGAVVGTIIRRVDRRRVEEWAVAFALGLGVAAVYFRGVP